jgi:putative endonuclease
MWYVYFLELHNKHVYVGSTDDLRRRLTSHESGHVLSTRSHRPVILMSYIAVRDEAHARRLERYFQVGVGQGVRLEAPIDLNVSAALAHLNRTAPAPNRVNSCPRAESSPRKLPPAASNLSRIS